MKTLFLFAEKQFLQLLQKSAIQQVENHLNKYAETVSMDTLKNCIRLFEKQKIIRVFYLEKQRMVELDEMYDTEAPIYDLCDKYNIFRNSH